MLCYFINNRLGQISPIGSAPICTPTNNESTSVLKPTAIGGAGSIPGWGTKILHDVWCSQKTEITTTKKESFGPSTARVLYWPCLVPCLLLVFNGSTSSISLDLTLALGTDSSIILRKGALWHHWGAVCSWALGGKWPALVWLSLYPQHNGQDFIRSINIW